eukprot:6094527-Prymnesium_polylepis.1
MPRKAPFEATPLPCTRLARPPREAAGGPHRQTGGRASAVASCASQACGRRARTRSTDAPSSRARGAATREAGELEQEPPWRGGGSRIDEARCL